MSLHILWQKDEVSEMLGTGYLRFYSTTGVHGLAKIVGVAELHVLAVQAVTPGTGQFRKFIDLCKAEFQTVYVWELWTDELGPVLTRYGFKPCTTVEKGERLTGMCWSRS